MTPVTPMRLPRRVYALAAAAWTARNMQLGVWIAVMLATGGGVALFLVGKVIPPLVDVAALVMVGGMIGGAVWGLLLQSVRCVALELRARATFRTVMAEHTKTGPAQWQVTWAIEPYDPGTDASQELSDDGKARNIVVSTFKALVWVELVAIGLAAILGSTSGNYALVVVCLGLFVAGLVWVGLSPPAAKQRRDDLRSVLSISEQVPFFPGYPPAGAGAERFPLYEDFTEDPLFPRKAVQRDRASNPDCHDHAGEGLGLLSGLALCAGFPIAMGALAVSRSHSLIVLLALTAVALVPAYPAFRRNLAEALTSNGP